MTRGQVIGIVATGISSVAILPQSLKTVFSGDTLSLSIWYYILLLIASVCWLVYAITLRDEIISLWAVVQLCMLSVLVSFKLINVYAGIDTF